MVILLVALTFLVIVSVDAILERRRRAELVHVGDSLHARLRSAEPNFVAGYEMPSGLHFHRGHLWVHWVAPDQAYVGLDDFGRRLVGHPDKVRLPHTGSWTDQGHAAVELQSGDRKIRLQAPVSGEVIARNPAVGKDPETLHQDSYGRGWLYKVRSHKLADQIRGLLDGSLAARWMEDTRDQFHHQLVLASGSVIQDGGMPVEDLADRLEPAELDRLIEEFLSPQSSLTNGGR